MFFDFLSRLNLKVEQAFFQAGSLLEFGHSWVCRAAFCGGYRQWVRPRHSSNLTCSQAVFPTLSWEDAVRVFTEIGISNRDTSESIKYVMVSWT